MTFFSRAMPVVVLAAAVLLVGATIWGIANEAALFKRLVPERAATIGRHFIELLHEKNYAAIDASVDARIRGPKALDALAKAEAFLPPSIERIDIIGYRVQTATGDSGAIHELDYEVSGKNAWAYVTIIFSDDGRTVDLLTLHTQRLDDSLEHVNAFTFAGKGIGQFAFLLIVIALAAFVITTFAICYRSSELKNRWLWLLFILVGVVGVSMDWSTGQLSVAPISFHAPPFTVLSAGLYSPWIIGITLPVGALTFLIRRKALTAAIIAPIESQASDIAPA